MIWKYHTIYLQSLDHFCQEYFQESYFFTNVNVIVKIETSRNVYYQFPILTIIVKLDYKTQFKLTTMMWSNINGLELFHLGNF